jgi:hypothetical protein
MCSNCGHPQGVPVQRAVGPIGAHPVGLRRTDGQAVAALIFGIVGLVVCPLIPSIVAVILGSQARARIASNPDLDGDGLAKAGVILGWVGIGLSALGVVFVVLAFALGAAGSGF